MLFTSPPLAACSVSQNLLGTAPRVNLACTSSGARCQQLRQLAGAPALHCVAHDGRQASGVLRRRGVA